MQSFRERSGFQGNQHCYQQEPHELSRLENYRHLHGQTGQSYEAHSLSTAGMATAGTGPKDCYGQQTYPSYGSGSAQTKKPYRGGKAPSQHLQSGYSGHMTSGYSAQYMSEGHLQQKWDEPTQMSQYEQDIVGHLESRAGGSSQYLEQNMLAISQSQCHLSSQPSAPVYTSPHQQGHRPNPAPSPLMYPQSHTHFPQHSRTPSSTTSTYMEKCNPIPHGYKSGYGMPPNAQYSRQLGNHSSLKQSGYRQQNNYGYQQPPSRTGFEPQASLQGIPGTPESLQKFPHYNQNHQNYCVTDISVRSPEQYYQNCSPSSSHSPARSVGRSPSYSSTPSPLMPNPDTFQYGQPVNPAPSTSSTSLQDQNLLMPPHSHQSPSVNHQSQTYSSSMKERFSEKLFSNPSLWSLNALTSQVENISNNVQQLLLSEALMANKKNSKRNQPKKGEDYRVQFKTMDDSSCPDSQQCPLPSDPYGTPRTMPAELLEGGYSSSTEDQMERNYYYFGQSKGPTKASAHSQLSLDNVSTCSMNSTDDMSVRSGDSDRSLQSTVSEDNVGCDSRVQRLAFVEEQNSSLRSIRDERSPISVMGQSPMKLENSSPLGIKESESTLKENFEESAWTEKMGDEREIMKGNVPTEHQCKGEVTEGTEKQHEWLEDEKCPPLFRKLNKTESSESYSYENEDAIYANLKNKYEAEETDFISQGCVLSDTSSKGKEDLQVKSEILKSESPNVEGLAISSIPRDVLDSNQFLPEKAEDSPHLTSQGEPSDERLLTSETHKGYFEEKQCVSSNPGTEVKKESLTPAEEEDNIKTKLEEFSTEACSKPVETADGPLVSTVVTETTAQDTAHRSGERRSATCDIAPQSHSVKAGFSTLNEKTTPQTQTRDHIDHSDAKVLEPDSPQLPGKSIMHSAPSWADTPPSPQKGEEDIEPGISCPSAVTPSTKPEPVAPTAIPRLLGRKHTRGRRRLIHSNAAIRRQLSMEGNGALPSPQKATMPTSSLFSDQMVVDPPDISSQTPKLADGLPSRMCTRSLGSQNSPKVCVQEKRKPGPKPSSKPDPKPGPKSAPKPGTKPVLKPGSKLDLKQGPKSGPKSSSKPSAKSGPKYGSKPGPKTSIKPRAVPSVKLGPKPAAVSGLKPTEGVTPKGPGRPRGLTSKIKSMNCNDTVHTSTGCISEITKLKGNTEVTLETVVDTTLCTSVDSTKCSTLDTSLDAPYVNSVAKDQKSMVLRSRKQTQRKLTEHNDKEMETSTEASAMKLIETGVLEEAAPLPHENIKSPNPTDICADSLSQHDEEIVSVSIKRKSHLQSSDPVKKKKVPTISQPITEEPQELKNPMGHTRGRRRRGHKLEASICNNLTKETLPSEDNDTPCVPPLCLTKTKYLPPRKGRGLKYEAMVQKITSPASKKQPLTIQPDSVLEESTAKPAPEMQLTEKRKTVNATTLGPEEGESAVKTEESADAACFQTPQKKRRKWATVESNDAPDIALETGSLIINTPRLAKQRAIKNNHEMHLKQRKKKKVPQLETSVPAGESYEQTQDEAPVTTAAAPCSPPPTSSVTQITHENTPAEQLSVEIASTDLKPRRGRRPSLKKKQKEASGHQLVKEEEHSVKKKPGPKKKYQQNTDVIKVTMKESKLKAKCRKETIPTVKGYLSDYLKVEKGESKYSFKPYVHIVSSRRLASFCTIVNKAGEQQRLVQERQKSWAKMKNQPTFTKTIPNSTIMLQGPLVNKSLTDKCLVCCLCGKPANYRELGDLCGPYYPEDTVPRKTLSLTYLDDFTQNRDQTGTCSTEQVDALRKDDNKDSLQEGPCEGDCRQVTKRRSQLRTRLGLRMRINRLRLMAGRTSGAAPPAGEEGCYSGLQRLQLLAEDNEHWAHESCAVWTSGVILVAGKLHGLKEAAQESALTKCSVCESEGASLCCSWMSCTEKYHYVCAKETGCVFDEESFSITCPNHQAL